MHASFVRLLQAAIDATAQPGSTRRIGDEADLRRALDISPQTANNWKNRGVSVDGAVDAQRRLGVSATWVLDGGELNAPTAWTPIHHALEGVGSYTVAQDLSHPKPEDEPIACTWDFILNTPALPARFSVAAPDGALAPQTPRGTEFLFAATAIQPADGTVVIVQTGSGRRYMRLYFATGGAHWEARARDSAYPTLHSDRDQLQLLAAATHRAGGQG